MPFSTIPENRAIVNRLVDYICEHSLDELIAYTALSTVADKDLPNRHRYLLDRAIDEAEQRLGCAFECVYGNGIKRSEADDTARIGSDGISRVRRITRRAVKRMTRVNTNAMSADGRMLADMKIAHCNLIEGLADNRKTATIATPASADPFAARHATEKK
jgi:hypothetical protein